MLSLYPFSLLTGIPGEPVNSSLRISPRLRELQAMQKSFLPRRAAGVFAMQQCLQLILSGHAKPIHKAGYSQFSVCQLVGPPRSARNTGDRQRVNDYLLSLKEAMVGSLLVFIICAQGTNQNEAYVALFDFSFSVKRTSGRVLCLQEGIMKFCKIHPSPPDDPRRWVQHRLHASIQWEFNVPCRSLNKPVDRSI